MNNYYLQGWHGQLNAGDDAFAIVVSWGLRKYCYGESITMESDISGVLYKKCNIQLVQQNDFYFPGLSRVRRIYYLKKSKYFVLAGGSLFSEPYVDLLLHNSPLNSHKTISLGVSVGPFTSSSHEKKVLKCLNKMSYIGFRDDYSYEWANANTLSPYYTQSFDLATLLPLASEQKYKYALQNESNTNKLGVSLLAFQYLQDKNNLSQDIDFTKKLAQVIYNVAKERNIKLVLFSLCRNPNYKDDLLCETFINSLPEKDCIEVFKHDGDAYKTFVAISKCSHVVSMRLHGAIFAYTNQIPLLVLDYHTKCKEFARTIELDNKFCLNLYDFDFQQYEESLIDLLEHKKIQTSFPLVKAQELALLNFKCYDKWS